MKQSKSQKKEQDKTFEYDNLNEIDQKFEQFSENYRNKSQKQANVVPQMSLIKSIIKKKGPTFAQQVQSISQLSDLKNYFFNNCESKISLVERLSSTRALGDTPINFTRSATTKNSIILRGDLQASNDGRVTQQQMQQSQFHLSQQQGKNNQMINGMDANLTINNESFSRKNKKNLSFHVGLSMNQEISSSSKKQLEQQPILKNVNVKQINNGDSSVLTTPVQSPKKLQNSTLDLDSGIASTEIFSPAPSGQKIQINRARQVSLSNFSSLILKGDQTPLKGSQVSSQQAVTPTLREEGSFIIQNRQKTLSIGSLNNLISPLKILRERQRGNTFHVRDLSAPTLSNMNKKLNKGGETPRLNQRDTANFGEMSFQSQVQTHQVQSTPQNQSSSAYSELLQYKENIRKENRICQLVGQDLANFAIAAVLLIQQRDKKESTNLDITQKFLSAFGINKRALDSMRKEHEKREYVVKQIVSQLKEQYNQWQAKKEARDKEIQKTEIQYKIKREEQLEREKTQKDQFRWLKINTFYSELENNLKNMIVMKVNNFYNQNFLLDKIISKKGGVNINKEEQQQHMEDSQNKIDRLNDSNSSHILNFKLLSDLILNEDTMLEKENQQITRKRGQTISKNEPSNRTIQFDNNNQNQSDNKDNNHVIDEVSNKLLYIQISQSEQRKPSNIVNHKPTTMTDALNTKLENTDSLQKPLQKLYEKIKPRNIGENQIQRRTQSLQNVKGKLNPETLREAYNEQLNEYIAQKQSESKGVKNIKQFQIVKLQEQIDNCLKHGQTISESDQEAEYRWLKDNMIKGLSKQDYMDRQQRVLYDNYYWNQETEEIFVKKRNQLQHRNFQSVKSNNFSELTTYEFMRLILKNTNVQDINRENLMQRYQKGESLTEEQMEFLAATNQLLNKFIDKNFMKEAINILEKNDIVSTIELILAENILKSYNTVKNILYNHRETFLSHKNEYTRAQYDEKRKTDQEYQDFLKNLEIHKKKSKMYQTVLNYFEKKKLNYPVKEDHIYQGEIQQVQHQQKQKSEGSNIFSLEFANSTQESLTNEEMMVNQKKKAHELTHPKSMDKIMKYFNYHPPTKLILSETETPKINNDNQDQKKESSKQANKSSKPEKLRIKKMIDLQSNQQNFKKYYSGGPAQKQKKEINEKDHLKQILKIQSLFRMKLAQNLFRNKQQIYKKNSLQKLNFSMNEQKDKNYAGRMKSLMMINSNFTSRNTSPLPKTVGFNTHRSIENKDRGFVPAKKEVYQSLRKNISELQQIYQKDKRKQKQLRGRADRLIEYVRENNFFKIKQTGLNYDEGEVKMADKRENTALYYAVKNGNCLMAKFLLEKGANVNQPCHKMNTAMHIAFKFDDINMIFLLLQYNADLNAKNNKGYTPLGYARIDTLQRYGLEDAIAKKAIYHEHNIPSDHQNIDNNQFVAHRESQNFEKALIIEQGMQNHFQKDQYRDSFLEHTPARRETRQSSIKIIQPTSLNSKLEFSPERYFGKSSFRSNSSRQLQRCQQDSFKL